MDLIATTTVRKDPAELYAYWRRLEQLPDFMAHAEITQDEPGRVLAWRSLEGADLRNAGMVRFVKAPRDQGTEVRVVISYEVPGGKLGEALARWAGEDPHQQLDDELRRFKQVMETGEVLRSDGSPWGKRARHEFPQHAAQPLTDQEVIDLTGDKVDA